MIRIRQGLDIPISSEPQQTISVGAPVSTVALLGADYVGMKPTMAVREGDSVKLGQVLFTDKKTAGVQYTSPGCGKVVAVNRGEKRVFQSVVIELEGDEEETFTSYGDADLTHLSRDQVVDNLLASGLWTALRTRPYSKVPSPESTPNSIFITAIDTRPLAAKPEVVLDELEAEFTHGLQVLRHLTDGELYLNTAPGTVVPGADLSIVNNKQFDGPHPAGLPGTHIHFLDPVHEAKTVWHINYQDVAAIGHLFDTGRLSVDRVVSIAGPGIRNPRLVRTRIGASADDLLNNELHHGEMRRISGSVLSGRTMSGPFNFLGRFHNQISVLSEGTKRDFLGWMMPGLDKFSIKRVFASAFLGGPDKKYAFDTDSNGSRRAMVPIGMFEDVMPLDIIPTFLLRALMTGDTEQAVALGCLELDEEDLGLCTFVSPGKDEFGPILRDILQQIEKEG